MQNQIQVKPPLLQHIYTEYTEQLEVNCKSSNVFLLYGQHFPKNA